ncbi:hypothetical protein BJ138DRAFT_986310, partial [Hygrophoropsis aurantiaca]
LLDSRFKACKARPSLAHHADDLLSYFTRQAMSGDEEEPGDGPPKIFKIIDSQWKSQELRGFLRKLDEIYRAEWQNPHDGRRAISGNGPRVRISSEFSEPGKAPKGLPRNCYDPQFLANLRPWQKRKLNVLDHDYDFTIDSDEV